LVTHSPICSGSTDTRPQQSHCINRRPGGDIPPDRFAFPQHFVGRMTSGGVCTRVCRYLTY
jgi:hypothetical protein